MSDMMHKPMPVAGYVAQPQERIDLVNTLKECEERILRIFDSLGERDDVDKRWLAIGRTHLEQAFMGVARSIFRPQRVELKD